MEELRARREDILRVAQRYGASNVRVFGSVARGEADAESDVDFLVDVHTDARGWAFFGLLEDLRHELESLIGHRVDVAEDVKPHARETVARDLILL